MRVSTKRAKEISDLCHPGGWKESISPYEYADLAADLLEARNILKDIGRISAPCDTLGDAVFMVVKIERINAITTAYFTEEE